MNLPAQGTYQKLVTGLGHCNGQTIMADGALRFGGHSNAGQQETIEQTIADFPNPYNTGIDAYAMVYFIKDLQGNTIYSYGTMKNFPWDSGNQFRTETTTDPALIASLQSHTEFVAHAGSTLVGHDYDLMAYKATLDLDLEHQRLFGSPLWLEQWQFGQVASIHRSMAPDAVGDFFVGATAQQVLGGKSHLSIARVDNSHQLVWNTQLEDNDPSYPGHHVFREAIYLPTEDDVLAHGPKGWFPSRIFWLNALNGSLVRAREYDLTFFGRTYAPYWDHVLQDKVTGYDDLNLVGHTTYRPTQGSPAEIRLVYLRTTRQGISQAQKAYWINGEQLSATRIFQRNYNSFIVTGEIRNETTLESDGLLMEIDRNGTVGWAKRIHFGTFEETRDVHLDLNGNIWVSGATNAYQTNPDDHNFALFKFDGNGSLLQARYYLKGAVDHARSLLPTWGGDYIQEGLTTGFDRYYLRTDNLGEGPKCASVLFEPTVTNLSVLSLATTVTTHEIEHILESQPAFSEQDFQPNVSTLDCPDCNCDQ